MSRYKRRYEVLLPVKFNDGRAVSKSWFGEAVTELAERFVGASFQPEPIEGQWWHQGVVYRDKSVKIIVDVPDTVKNRRWMKAFKARWKERLEQLELWMVSYRIEME